MRSCPAVVSLKIGRTSTVQSGQIAGAGEDRFADKMPAIKVPCWHATLFGLSADRAIISANRMETLRHEIRMLSNDRPVYEPNLYFRAAASALH